MSYLWPFFFAILSLSLGASEITSPCDHIQIQSFEKLSFTSTEKRFMCGDQEVEAYAQVPLYQAQFVLKGFLQSRGFLNPQFEIKEERLLVETGEPLRLIKINIEGNLSTAEQTWLKQQTERFFKTRMVTPGLLDEVEVQALTLLRSHGRPCVSISTLMNVADEELTLTVNGLAQLSFGEVRQDEVEGLLPQTFWRFRPFDSHDTFNSELITLNEKRVVRSGLVQGTYFQQVCPRAEDPPNLSLSQSFIIGPPRVIRFGIGANTEVGPLARVKWSHHRLGRMGSLLEAQAESSFREQSLSLTSQHYFWPKRPRHFLKTEMILKREDLSHYEEVTAGVKAHYSLGHDHHKYSTAFYLGPAFLTGFYKTDINPERTNLTAGALEFGAQLMTHRYEFFDIHPEEGSLAEISFDFRHPKFGFDEKILKMESSLLQLFRLTEWGRGYLVAGYRLMAATTLVDDQVALDLLPPSLKFYGGGSNDIRGHKLKALPFNQGLGALTKLGGRFELRRSFFLISSLEAYTFFDIARFGERSWDLEKAQYYSPGVGLRWLSPIGLVQAYAARSLTSNMNWEADNLFFIGLGGQL